jgi:sulfotransferase
LIGGVTFETAEFGIAQRHCFLSGLPRSGSTLLANILRQNPRFHVSGTSGLLPLLKQVRLAWARNRAFQAADPDGMATARLRVLRSVFTSFYADVSRPVVCDKSRGWTGNVDLAEALLGERARIVACVRDPRDVMASLERLRQRNQLEPDLLEMARPEKWQTIEGRCEVWFGPRQLVGKPYRLIREALARGHGDRLHFVDYVRLTREPETVLSGIYRFLGEEPFAHDFGNIASTVFENDAVWRSRGLHEIRPKLEPAVSDWHTVIPREVGARYPGGELWADRI